MKIKTLSKSLEISGQGLHTGKAVNMTIEPQDQGFGIQFLRTDIEKEIFVKADVNYVFMTQRGTSLKREESEIHTVEHLLSALYALGVSNVLIKLNGPEVPIIDGSSLPFVNAIHEAGLVEQEEAFEVFEIREALEYVDEATGSEVIVKPCNILKVTCMIDFESELVGQQYATLDNLDEYEQSIAPARTFVFLHELMPLLEAGLVKGGNLENAVVLADRSPSESDLKKLRELTGYHDLKINLGGVANNTSLRFANEPARHKLLDVLGDFALIGKRIKGEILIKKPGHTANVGFGKLLKKKYVEFKKIKGLPVYDPSAVPVMDHNQITDLLPHRYPFLLLDKIIELSDQHVVGLKNVSFNEWFFPGHFPQNPVFPGVLQMEALAQAGGILALSIAADPNEKYDTYFLKLDKVKFKQKVVPGDTMILRMELAEPVRRGIVRMYGTVYVGKKIVSEGELTAQIVKRTKD